VGAALAELPEQERQGIEGKIAGESVEETAGRLGIEVKRLSADVGRQGEAEGPAEVRRDRQ
jgi:hypothetical protein